MVRAMPARGATCTILLLSSVGWSQAAPSPAAPTSPPAPPGYAPPPNAPPGYAPPPPPGYAPSGYAPPPPGVREPIPPPPAPEEPHHAVSLTLSPLHLLLPVVELTAEARVHRMMGISGIVGIGSVKIEYQGTPPPGLQDRASVYELGAQYNVYVLGSFEQGMQLGLELLYLHANVEAASVSGAGSGLAVGPLIGYKIITSVGFTFMGQLGVEFVAIKAKAQDTSGNSASDQGKATIPLLNLNVGWSF
jgi:hypothetical protein